MSNETDSVPMMRFWFCVYRENPLFHAERDCHHLQDLPRDPENLSVAHIPVDSNDVGKPSKLNFCTACGVADPFE
ncbi:hypothetical protein [Haloterrigena salinisoli]|uniref:hypothetical protein n=1 Tax=Haloterrigena salinisoli TaxID=3132747 RepID=UPI0030D0A72B